MGSVDEGPWHNFSKIHSHTTRKEGENIAMLAKDEPWLSASAPLPNVHIRVHDVSFHVNKECMASKSAKLTHLLQSTNQIDLTKTLPSDPQTFIQVVYFCYGLEPLISSENAISLACLAAYLKMNEDHSPDNLFKTTMTYIETRILPNWNETIKAFKSITEQILPHAEDLGILFALIKSIYEKVASDPNLLVGDHTSIPSTTRRKLFAEDFTTLPFHLYTRVVFSLTSYTNETISPQHLAQGLYRYAIRWIGQKEKNGNEREVIEMVEKLMPSKKGSLHVKCLFQLLNYAMSLQASKECKQGFESRIGKQLLEASVEDLCNPHRGSYIKTTKYDTRLVARILSCFPANNIGSCEFEALCKLLEDYLAVIGADRNLRKEEFLQILEVLASVLKQVKHRGHDGVYRAIDVYLDAHRHSTETEREDICRCLDFMRLSVEASEHAAKSERLPLRAIAQVLFVGQLRIRQELGELREEEVAAEVRNGGGGEEDEIEKMDERVSLLEDECLRMRNEIEKEVKHSRGRRLWKEVKNVFGCKSCTSCRMRSKGRD